MEKRRVLRKASGEGKLRALDKESLIERSALCLMFDDVILVWPTQLDPALGTLFVCVCVYHYMCVSVCPRHVIERRVT